MTVVISQPMYFPWPGIFEQMKLADLWIHLDDVALPGGQSFMTRVQIKPRPSSCPRPLWLTVPRIHTNSGQCPIINEVLIDNSWSWREKHLRQLEEAYAKSLFVEEMLPLAKAVLGLPMSHLAELTRMSVEMTADRLGICTEFAWASWIGAEGTGSERILNLLKAVDATRYVTGHGARNYLDHELLEDNGICVEYIDYQKIIYPQLHGPFTPFVSTLDLIANTGPDAGNYIQPKTRYWKDFVRQVTQST